jgi:hypothetical protein
MTDSLQSYDLELLKRYDAELQEVELLPPAAIELTARQALALVTHMQIAVANPGVKDWRHLPLTKQKKSASGLQKRAAPDNTHAEAARAPVRSGRWNPARDFRAAKTSGSGSGEKEIDPS